MLQFASLLPLLVPAALLLAAAGACSGSGPRGRGDGGAALAGRDCSVDAECGALKCDPIRRQCVCQSDADCADRFCNNFTGLCTDSVSGCKDDAECTSSEFCDPQIRACRLRRGLCEPCSTDTECGGTKDNCLLDVGLNQKFCGKSCATSVECPRGTTCQDPGNGALQCWPEIGKNCKTFTGCIPDSFKPCTPTDGGTGDEQCRDVPDQTCDPGRGICVARTQLCPFGMVCDPATRICVPSCTVDADCVQGQRCANRFCEPIGTCTTDAECPVNKVCNATTQQCVAFCSSTANCPLGEICTITPDNRSKCVPGCTQNADCPPSAKCVKPSGQTLGSCQAGACQTNDVCAVCQVCNLSSLACESAKNTGYCKPCAGDSDCGGAVTNSYCLAMQDGNFCGKTCPKEGCPAGFFCASATVSGGVKTTQCVPADLKCKTAAGANRCGF